MEQSMNYTNITLYGLLTLMCLAGNAAINAAAAAATAVPTATAIHPQVLAAPAEVHAALQKALASPAMRHLPLEVQRTWLAVATSPVGWQCILNAFTAYMTGDTHLANAAAARIALQSATTDGERAAAGTALTAAKFRFIHALSELHIARATFKAALKLQLPTDLANTGLEDLDAGFLNLSII